MQLRPGGILGVTCLELASMITGTNPAEACGYVVVLVRKDDTFQLASSACCKDTLLAALAMAIHESIAEDHPGGKCPPPT